MLLHLQKTLSFVLKLNTSNTSIITFKTTSFDNVKLLWSTCWQRTWWLTSWPRLYLSKRIGSLLQLWALFWMQVKVSQISDFQGHIQSSPAYSLTLLPLIVLLDGNHYLLYLFLFTYFVFTYTVHFFTISLIFFFSTEVSFSCYSFNLYIYDWLSHCLWLQS